MFDKYLEDHKKDIVDTVSDLIHFPSVSKENLENKDAPFGSACENALEYILSLGKSMGFRTKNIDHYCGYIEFGEGKELVGIIGHLDVVPAIMEDGWSTPPFEASIRDGKLFGRGAIDDKGPVVAALYAMKAVLEHAKVQKRVRLILGLNEEKAWKCINHYKEVEESPTISFSPDANFPAIYAEKGILSLELKYPFHIKNVEILNIECNQNALNVVPKYCSITLKLKDDTISLKPLEDAMFHRKIEVQDFGNHTVKLISYGTAAHAAHPELGINAITNLIYYLIENLDMSQNHFLKKLQELGVWDTESPEFLSRDDIAYPTEFEDSSIIQDESGVLTSNIAYLDYINEKIIIKMNLRVPVKTNLDTIIYKYKCLTRFFEDLECNVLSRQEPLYVPKDSYLVKTLVDIFNQKTGMHEEAIAIGGGTYARAFENSISYGVTFPGDLDMCHQVNEFVEIDKLILSSKIYAQAIYELAKS